MKYITLLAILAQASLAAVADVPSVNSGLPSGYLDRGVFYYDASLSAAAVDQLSHFDDITDPNEQSTLMAALAEARDADPRALASLTGFLASYPQSTVRYRVINVIGNCYMDRSEWVTALSWYVRVPGSALDDNTDASRHLNMAIALIRLDRLERADSILSTLAATSQGANALFYRGYIAYSRGDYSQARSLLDAVTDTHMPAALAPYYLCQIYYMQGDYTRAYRGARRIADDRDMPVEYRTEACRIAGEALYNNGDTDRAIEYLRRYIATTPGEPLPSALYILGMSYYRSGDYRDAIESLRSPSTLDDAMGQSALLTIGQSYMYLGDVSAAIIALNRAVELNIDERVTEEAYYNYCVARCDGGRMPFGSSVPVFEAFLKRYPRSRYAANVSEYLAYGYMNDDNYDAALVSINKIPHPSQAVTEAKQQVLYILGSRETAAGHYDRAIDYLNQARAISGGDSSVSAECELLLGDCYYHKNDYEHAAACYSGYLSRASSQAPNASVAIYNLGYARFALHQYDNSLKSFNQLLGRNDVPAAMQADAHSRIGDCLYASRRLDDALSHYDKAVRIDPATADYPLYQLAVIKGWQGNRSGLVDGLNAMIARYPTSPLVPKALLDIAESYTQQGRVDDAIAVYRRVERDFSGTGHGRQALLLMGSLQSSNDRPADAYDTYSRLIKRNSPSAEATLAVRYMQALAAEQGRLDEFVAFMNSVPNAPAIDPSEIDRATFTAAHTPDGWEKYLSRYPAGEYAPQALLLLAQHYASTGNSPRALEYASRLVTDYPDGEYVADALVVKGDAEMEAGDIPAALDSYSRLEARASTQNQLNHSRMGMLRASRDLGSYDDVVRLADMLLSSSSLGGGQQSEVSFTKAVALSNIDRGDEAVEIWRSLSDNPADLVGAKSLFYMARHYYETGDKTRAWQAVNTLVDSNTPHSYWLARGYILMSDLYRDRGDTFEADEYLKSLRANYPGNEPDIFSMIDTRLNKE